ncbi:MAG TPA: hypothetical protein VFO54_06320 [Chryseosolibacter sp.]|nr:hypothetical protein [Chryseosolibacter sp.]
MSSISIRSSLTRTLAAYSLLLVSGLFIRLQAQVLQTGRFEVPVEARTEFFDIIPSSDNGLFLYRQFAGDKEDQIQLIKLDTAFAQNWGGFVSVRKNYRLMGIESYDKKLFLLLRYIDYRKNDLLLYAIDEADGHYLQFTIKGYIPFSPTEFRITDNAALIGGYYNRIPVVLHYSFLDHRSKVLPGLFNEAGELTQIKTNEDGSFDVLICARNPVRQKTIWIKNYDAEGNLMKNLPLQPEESKHLIFGRSIKTDGDKQIVAGVYGTRSSEYSRGVFIATIEPSGSESIKYYNFGDLNNFFQYMKASREKRIKDRIERKKIKGKKIRFNYRFLVHELIPYKDQFVLLGEAFYPRYVTVDPMGFRMSPSMNYNGRIFDGYYYTHAVVMGFNGEGKLLWDNSFEINDVKTFTLEQFVKLHVFPDRLALMYLFENHIRTKIIQDNTVLEGKSIDPIRTFKENEVIKGERYTKNKLEYWYKNYLYAYGIQDIVTPSRQGQARRKVFFINKLHYQ